MPDKYPLTPGHTLIISKAHLACYGEGTAEVHRELERAASQVEQFLRHAYGRPLFIWENGAAGQSVFHAHLHLIPVTVHELSPELEAHPEVIPIAGWETVRAHFARCGSYRYLELGGKRRLLPGHGPVLRAIVRLLSEGTGLEYSPAGWVKTTTPADVTAVGDRWSRWRQQPPVAR